MKRFSRILFVADTGNDDSAAFGQAVTLANNNQAQLTVVGLVDAADIRKVNAPAATMLLDAMVEERRDQLQALARNASVAGLNIEIKVLVGNGFVEIIREALSHKRDLVVKSVEKTANIRQRLFGGTDLKLMRNCPCPVWSIKSTQQRGYREILVGLDYDPDNPENEALNLQILEMASSLALADFSELHIVHAWHLPHEAFLRGPRMGNTVAEVDLLVQEEENKRRHWLSDMVERGCAAQGGEAESYLEPQLHLVKGIARRVVPECVKEIGAELVIMGTVGRTGIPGFLMGNTAEAILDQIDCSVLAVKPAGFISPVTLEI